MKKKTLDLLSKSDNELIKAKNRFLNTLPYDDGLPARRYSGRYYDLGGITSGIGSLFDSITNESKMTTYEDLKRQHDYNNMMALRGISDNDALLSAYDNLDFANPINMKDVRSSSWGDDISNVAQTAIGGISATKSPWGALFGLLPAAKIAIDRTKASNTVNTWNGLINANNAKLMKDFGKVASNVDTINDRRLLEAYYNLNAFGGTLSTHGADWDNGLTQINAGGTHESNPNDGVPAGVDENGTPNLVEEGEVIWNNEYVFSNRLKVPQKLRNKYKLGGPITYADAVKKLTKESEERKSDPISNATNKAIVNEFIDSQEEVRAKKQQRAAERLQQAQYENELLNAIAGLGAEQVPMGPVDIQMPAQEVSQEVPVVEQMGAYGGNLFEDGGNLFELGGPSGVSLSKEDIEQLRIEKEAKEYAKRYLESIGEKPTERKINSIARDIAYNKSVTINPNGSVKLDYEPDRVRWRSRDNWRLEKYPIVETTDSTTGASIGGTSTLEEIPVDGGMLEEVVVTANQDPNAGRQTPPPPPDPNAGRGNGNQGGSNNDNIRYNRSINGKEFESQEYYQNFLNYLRNDASDEDINKWIDKINTDIKAQGDSYQVKNKTDLIRLATDGKVGPVHQAFSKSANDWSSQNPTKRPSFGLEKPKNGLEDALEDYNNSLANRAYGRTELDIPDYREFRDIKEPKTQFDWRREAPIIGGLAQSLFGLFGEPDYSNADAVLEAAERMGAPVSIPVETIGDYVKRRPFDERYLVNIANQNRVAAERSAANTAGGNRAMQLGADAFLAHSNQQELGEIMRQAYLANRQDEFSTAEFNRGTNLQNMSAINSRNLAQAQLNSSRQQAGLSGLISGRTMRQNIYDRDVATTGANLSNLYDNLSLRGKEAIDENLVKSMYDLGYTDFTVDNRGNITFRAKKKNGGQLKKKRRF